MTYICNFLTIGYLSWRLLPEFPDPAIVTDPALPISAGSDVRITCLLNTAYEKVNFEWDCLENRISIEQEVHQYNSTFSTFVIRKMNLTQDDESCTCLANVEGIVAKKSIRLSISGKPIIETAGKIRCNSSSFPNISCSLRTGLLAYGFSSWLHFNNGIFIRRLNGTIEEKKSILNIESCSYQDAGEYTCDAWTFFGDIYYAANKSVTLLVDESPVIISSRVTRKQKTDFSVLFYSTSETHSIWRQLNHSLINSTKVMQTIEKQIIGVQFYNATIECEVYMANLSVSFPTGRYEIILKNTFGETKYYFTEDGITSKDMTAPFSLWILVFALISFGIFILTAVGTTILTKGRNVNNVIHIVGPHERCPTIPIYHSAPAFPQPPHLYDTTDNGYLEVIDNAYELDDYSEIDNTDDEDDMPFNTHGDYEEIE